MLKNYIKIAWKVLGRNKFFTFVSLFGISFTLAVLIIIAAFLTEMMGASYPVYKRDRILTMNRVQLEDTKNGGMMIGPVGFHLLDHYIKKMKTPERIALASNPTTTNTFIGNKKLKLQLRYTDANYWEVFDFQFLEGRPYNENVITNNEFVAVISKSTKEAYFGQEVNVIGKTITTDNTNYLVIGVVKDAPIYQDNSSGDLYAPYNTSKSDLKQQEFSGQYVGIILAKNKKDIPAIKAEFNDIISKIPVPPAGTTYDKLRAWAYTRAEDIARNITPSRNDDEPPVIGLYAMIIGAMLLFMLLPTLNLININTSRIMERASEIGVRKAFGASTSVLTVQFIVENIVLTLIGGAIGLLTAWIVLNIIENSGILPHAHLNINFKVFLIAIGMCLVFGFISGVLPALRMSRMQVVQAIKGGEM